MSTLVKIKFQNLYSAGLIISRTSFIFIFALRKQLTEKNPFFCSFLLDRLLQYEKVDESSGDSDMTASSDSEPETVRHDGAGTKR